MTEQSAKTVSNASKKTKKVTSSMSKAGPKKTAEHPTYNEMVKKALAELKERGGSSRHAILKYIMANFKVGTDEHAVNSRMKIALKNGVKSAAFKQSKGTGASGSFRLGEKQTIVKKAKVENKTAKLQKKASPKEASKPKQVAASPKKAATKPKTKAVMKSKVNAVKPKSPKKLKTVSTPKPKVAKKMAKPKKAASPKKTGSKKN